MLPYQVSPSTDFCASLFSYNHYYIGVLIVVVLGKSDISKKEGIFFFFFKEILANYCVLIAAGAHTYVAIEPRAAESMKKPKIRKRNKTYQNIDYPGES